MCPAPRAPGPGDPGDDRVSRPSSTPTPPDPSGPSDDGGDREAEARGRRFLDHLRGLGMRELARAVHEWRDVMAGPDGALWFAAEQELARAVDASHRQGAQRRLVRALADVFMSRPWFTVAQPGADFRMSEPSAQYVATNTLLALLVHDRLARRHADVLYRPFRNLIPVDGLVDVESRPGRAADRVGDRRPDRAADRIADRVADRVADRPVERPVMPRADTGTSERGTARARPATAPDESIGCARREDRCEPPER